MSVTYTDGWLYEEDTRILSLANLNALKADESKFSKWYTRKHWHAQVNYSEGIWHFNSYTSNNEHIIHIQSSDIFELIRLVLEKTKD